MEKGLITSSKDLARALGYEKDPSVKSAANISPSTFGNQTMPNQKK